MGRAPRPVDVSVEWGEKGDQISKERVLKYSGVSNGGPDLDGGTAGRVAGTTGADGTDDRAISASAGRSSGSTDWSA
jgi:hypothetical protein